LRRGANTAVEEPEPGHCVDEHPRPIDEIRDPENTVAQENGDFASLAQPQKLALMERVASWSGLIANPLLETVGRASPQQTGHGGSRRYVQLPASMTSESSDLPVAKSLRDS
jgi:hypothetical protein